jgi:hypothetical protein
MVQRRFGFHQTSSLLIFGNAAEYARKTRAGICGESVESVAMFRYDKADIEGRTWIAIDRRCVSDGASAVRIQYLRSRHRLCDDRKTADAQL